MRPPQTEILTERRVDSMLKALDALPFSRTLFAFDFDGTLAPIVKQPASARMDKRTERLIARLNERVPVAVISGRSVSDLKSRLHFEPRYLVGNHGIESLSRTAGDCRRSAEICTTWREQLVTRIGGDASISWLQIEDKEYSLSLHYRKAKNKVRAKRLIPEIADGLRPRPRIIPGKAVFNLVPEGAPHKGTAMIELLRDSGLSAAIYLGDDDTDEDVFSLKDPRILGIRVGYKRASNAQFFLKSQSQVAGLIDRLLRQTGASSRKPSAGAAGATPSSQGW
jgi:trehalose 6-phosphate phosphatase